MIMSVFLQLLYFNIFKECFQFGVAELLLKSNRYPEEKDYLNLIRYVRQKLKKKYLNAPNEDFLNYTCKVIFKVTSVTYWSLANG